MTVALTVAGWPTGIPNPAVSTVTTGRQSRPSWPSAVMALDSAAVCAAARGQRDRRLPGRVAGGGVHRPLRDRGPPGGDHERDQQEDHGREDDQLQRGVALVYAGRPRRAGTDRSVLLATGQGPVGAVNFSVGAWTTWLTVMARPGTNVGT